MSHKMLWLSFMTRSLYKHVTVNVHDTKGSLGLENAHTIKICKKMQHSSVICFHCLGSQKIKLDRHEGVWKVNLFYLTILQSSSGCFIAGYTYKCQVLNRGLYWSFLDQTSCQGVSIQRSWLHFITPHKSLAKVNSTTFIYWKWNWLSSGK